MGQFRVRRRGLSVRDIVEEEGTRAGVKPKEMINGSRWCVMSRLQGVVAHRYSEEVGVFAAEIARHHGETVSSITRASASLEEQRGN